MGEGQGSASIRPRSHEQGVPIQVALAKIVRAMGGKEFAARVRMVSPTVPNGSVESPSGGASLARVNSRLRR